MIIDLIKALYNPHLPLPQDFHTVLTEIERDGISSQIYFLLKQQGRLEQTPEFFQKFLKEQYTKGLYQNIFIKNQMDQILQAFEKAGIDVIPLKGVYLAEKFFGHLGSRITSDIDLLVRGEELDKAIRIVKELGFTDEEAEVPDHFHCSFDKPLPHSAIPLGVELHWAIIKEKSSSLDMNDVWEQSKPVGSFRHIKELSDLYTFYTICLHGWQHNLESMKYFLDIMQIIYKKKDEIDYDLLMKLSASHQTLTRITRILSIVYQQFPHLEAVKKFPYKIVKVSWKYRDRGVKKYFHFLNLKFFSYDLGKHSLLELIQWFLPSRMDAVAQLGRGYEEFSTSKLYLLLYRNRMSKLISLKNRKCP